jgi:hypothetical protein
MKSIALFALILALGCVGSGAQLNPGDYVAPLPSTTGSSIVQITPGGTVKTLFTVPFVVSALTMAPNNVDLAVVARNPVARAGFLATVTPSGTVTTLTSYASYIYENVAPDSNGTYAVPVGTNGTDVVLRIDRVGGKTTVTPSPPVGGGKPRGMAVDIGTGGYLMGDIPNLFLIARDGTSKTVHTGVAINNSIDMMSDARTSTAVISQQNSLVSVDTVTGVMTTIQGGFNGCFPGLAYDRARDAWVLAGSCANTNMNVYRVLRGGGVTTVTGLVGASDIEVYGSRNIVATSDPTPGSNLSLGFSEPNSAGAFYLAAASFSTSPGIPTPVGTIDLTPDPFFFLSLAAPGVFVNFQGVLDAQGSALAAVAVPPIPGLKGFRFFVSFVTVRGSALNAVANTVGFTIQ